MDYLVSTIFYGHLLITGLILWFPNKKKKIKSSITIKGKPALIENSMIFFKVLGATQSIVLLTLSLTGLMWSFDWYKMQWDRSSVTIDVRKVPRRGNTKEVELQRTNDVKTVPSFQLFNGMLCWRRLNKRSKEYSYIRLGKIGNSTSSRCAS